MGIKVEFNPDLQWSKGSGTFNS